MVEVEPNSFPGIRIIINYYPNPAIIPSEQAKLSNIQLSGDFYTVVHPFLTKVRQTKSSQKSEKQNIKEILKLIFRFNFKIIDACMGSSLMLRLVCASIHPFESILLLNNLSNSQQHYCSSLFFCCCIMRFVCVCVTCLILMRLHAQYSSTLSSTARALLVGERLLMKYRFGVSQNHVLRNK